VTRLDRLQELAELLADTDITPTGFTLIGVPRTGRDGYYGSDRPRIATGDADIPAARAAAVR
jgi:hypothetical protein